jgi:putative DNA primase/helicase
MSIHPPEIPAELRNLPQWVAWKYENGTKLPVNVNTNKLASSTDPSTWTTFETAVSKRNGHAGIGFVFSADDEYCGIDFDACYRNDTGETAPWALTWITKLNSYSEISPSGTGIKVWVKAKWPLQKGKQIKITDARFVDGKDPGIEVYDHGRYFAVTGHRLSDYPAEIQERQDIINELCRTYFPNGEALPARSTSSSTAPSSSPSSVVERARKYLATMPGAISGSGGHKQTYRAACVLVLGFDLSTSESLELMLEYNQRCKPEWTEAELVHKIGDAGQESGPRGYLRDKDPNWKTAPIPDYLEPVENLYTVVDKTEVLTIVNNPPDLLKYGFHDAGNAERIVAVSGANLRYCHPFRKWLWWDGRRWAVDETSRSLHLAKMMAVEFLRQATIADNADAQKFARNTLNARLLKSALELATPDLSITPAELDTYPWLLNCLNGTVDLRSGVLLPHDPKRYITRLVHNNYNPAARCPTWQLFLYRVMGIEQDEDRAERMVRWLQKAHGYSMTGSTREKAVFVCYGPTDTGKTTMTSTIRGIAPEYSVLIQIDSLMMRREETNNSQSDLADLRGARVACTSETEAGQRLAVGKLKRITQGQGDIKAVRKYENPVTFRETHKLWLDANHKPIIRDTDDSIWNRVHLIPFEVQIPKQEQDRDLPAKLMAEAEGILAWIVAGAARWYAEGLGKPQEVTAAGNAWKEESDTLGDFILDRCVMRADAEAVNTELWKAYTTWCEQNAEHPMRRIQFLNALVERGCNRTRDMKGRKLAGIELRSLFS